MEITIVPGAKTKGKLPDIVREIITATNFMALSYKSLNVGPKYYTKVNSLRKSEERKEPWQRNGG